MPLTASAAPLIDWHADDIARAAGLAVTDRGGHGDCSRFVTADPGFRLDLPATPGNYRVTLTLGDRSGTSDTTVKAEARRLMLESVQTRRGQSLSRDFIVNLRDAQLPPPEKNAPGGSEVRLSEPEKTSPTWDDRLNLEFLGTPKVCALKIEAVQVPTVWLAGDSTVTDHPEEPYAAWGQMLPRFFKPDIAVANYAQSGETLKSSFTGLRLDKMLELMQPGDWLLIQFTHNDQKKQWPQTYVAADTTFPAMLRYYIAEARRHGVQPVLVTSMERRRFDADGHIVPSLQGYPDAERQLAAEEQVPLIDLNRASIRFYEALGPSVAPKAFAMNGADATHHDNYGAYQLARIVVDGIRDQIPTLAAHLQPEIARYDPTHPPAPESFTLPPSLQATAVKPAGN